MSFEQKMGDNPFNIQVTDEEKPLMDRVIEIAGDKTISDEERDRRYREIDPTRALAGKAVKQIEGEIRAMNGDREKVEKLVDSWKMYGRDWDIEQNPDLRFVLQANDCSRIHKFHESTVAGLFYDGDERRFIEPSRMTDVLDKAKVFVVRHDWAAAFGDSLNPEDPYKLPAEICAFEFRVSGHTIIMLQRPGEGFYGNQATILLEGVQGLWFTMAAEGITQLGEYLTRQVRAICVALEAQVAVHSVVRAPSKLNEKREAKGKPPLADFHIVDLSRRARAAARPDPQPTGRRVRMHFRRGHWRHFEDGRKTWIEWMLCGDPDLGFIDKHYRV